MIQSRLMANSVGYTTQPPSIAPLLVKDKVANIALDLALDVACQPEFKMCTNVRIELCWFQERSVI